MEPDKELTDSEKLDKILATMEETRQLVNDFLADFKGGKIPGPLGMLGKMMGK